MNKSAEFEVSFTPILDINVKQFKKEFYGSNRYYLGANIFTISSDGRLIVSSPASKIMLKCNTWISRVKLLTDMQNSVKIFISITEESKGVECNYECELPKF